MRSEYRAARTGRGLAALVVGAVGLFNLGIWLFAAGVWVVWSVILLVVFVFALIDGSGAAAVYGLLFFVVFFGPLLWAYLKYLGEERQRKEKAENQNREREAREGKTARRRQHDGGRVNEEVWEEFASADKYRTMASEWERRWGILTKDLTEEESRRLHKKFLTDNPGRTDEERWQHIDALFKEKSVP